MSSMERERTSGSTAASAEHYRYGGPDIEERDSETWNLKLNLLPTPTPSPSLSYYSAKTCHSSDPSVNGPSTSVNSMLPITMLNPRSPESVDQADHDNQNMSLSLRPSSGMEVDGILPGVDSNVDELNGKNSYIISARKLRIIWGDNPRYWIWTNDNNSRFHDVAVLKSVCWLEINGTFDLSLLTPETTYGVYLIYKLARKAKGLKNPYHQTARIEFNGTSTERTIRLDSKTLEAHVEGRGWNQMKLGQFHVNGNVTGQVHAQVKGSEGLYWKYGLIIEGMEFRPEH